MVLWNLSSQTDFVFLWSCTSFYGCKCKASFYYIIFDCHFHTDYHHNGFVFLHLFFRLLHFFSISALYDNFIFADFFAIALCMSSLCWLLRVKKIMYWFSKQMNINKSPTYITYKYKIFSRIENGTH